MLRRPQSIVCGGPVAPDRCPSVRQSNEKEQSSNNQSFVLQSICPARRDLSQAVPKSDTVFRRGRWTQTALSLKSPLQEVVALQSYLWMASLPVRSSHARNLQPADVQLPRLYDALL